MTELVISNDPTGDSGTSPRLVRFGAFELDRSSGELRRGGIRVHLQDQPFRLLDLLVSRPGEIVTRDEIRQRLWPSEFVDFEQSLNGVVRKLRASLDDSADNPRFIETLARRGYRFIAPVAGGIPAQQPVAMIAAPAPAAGGRKALWIVVGALVLIASIAAGLRHGLLSTVSSRRPIIASRPSPASVAIMPFANPDAVPDPLVEGLTETVIDNVSRMPQLRVMSRTTVFRYKDRPVDPARVARELNVAAIVTGDLRQAGDRYTLHVELVDVSDGSQLWGQRYESTSGELQLLPVRVSADLAQRLRRGVARKGPPVLIPYTESAEAYDLYLKGRYAWNQRKPEKLRQALELFEQAAAADPTFAAAYAGTATAYGVMVGYGLIAPQDGVPRVLAAAEKALSLDPGNADAIAAIATTRYRNLWDFAGAEREYRRAIAVNPSNATAHQWYADYLRSMGRFAEGRKENELAVSLDPLSAPVAGANCWAFYAERNYHRAIDCSRVLDKLSPGRPITWDIFMAFTAAGSLETAVRRMESVSDPHNREMAAAYRRGGFRGVVERRRALLLDDPTAGTSHPIEIAETYALLGDHDSAFRWLEIAYQNRVSRVTSICLVPAFDTLRSDPRFEALVLRIGLPIVPVPGNRVFRAPA